MCSIYLFVKVVQHDSDTYHGSGSFVMFVMQMYAILYVPSLSMRTGLCNRSNARMERSTNQCSEINETSRHHYSHVSLSIYLLPNVPKDPQCTWQLCGIWMIFKIGWQRFDFENNCNAVAIKKKQTVYEFLMSIKTAPVKEWCQFVIHSYVPWTIFIDPKTEFCRTWIESLSQQTTKIVFGKHDVHVRICWTMKRSSYINFITHNSYYLKSKD